MQCSWRHRLPREKQEPLEYCVGMHEKAAQKKEANDTQ